jgi:hypothetical protein
MTSAVNAFEELAIDGAITACTDPVQVRRSRCRRRSKKCEVRKRQVRWRDNHRGRSHPRRWRNRRLRPFAAARRTPSAHDIYEFAAPARRLRTPVHAHLWRREVRRDERSQQRKQRWYVTINLDERVT